MAENMELVGVRLTTQLISKLDELVEEGQYPNRSEALREAARIMIRLQHGMFDGRARPVDKDKIAEEFARSKGFKL